MSTKVVTRWQLTALHALYDAISTTDNPKAQMFLAEWKILFGEVCGYDVEHPSDRIRKLAEFYQVGSRNSKPELLLMTPMRFS